METNTTSFTITKRDGKTERFSLDKIMNAIIKAFNALNEPIDLGRLSKILARLDIHNGITVEEIQNQVEVALMQEGYYNVAKEAFEEQTGKRVVTSLNMKQYLDAQQPTLGLEQDSKE